MEVGFTPVAAANAITGTPISRRDVRFHTDYRLDTRFFCLFLEFPGAVQVAMIGNREGWLLELESPRDQVVDPVSAV
jgi:hypothetical protein